MTALPKTRANTLAIKPTSAAPVVDEPAGRMVPGASLFRWNFWVLAALAVLVIGGAIYKASTWQGETASEVKYHTVERGDFRVSIVEGGSLEAVRETNIFNLVGGTSRIIWLIDEGTYVDEGELLVELDSTDLQESRTSQLLAVSKAREDLERARTDLVILQSQNQSLTRDSELDVKFAAAELEKYREGDWPKKRNEAEQKIILAEEEMRRAIDRMGWTEKLAAQGYATKSEMDADSLKVKRAQIETEQAKEALRLMVKYEYPKEIEKLKANLEQARDELFRVKQRAESNVSRAKRDIISKNQSLETQEKRLKHLEEEIGNTKIRAPQDGLVVYSGSDQRSGFIVEEGGQVRNRQRLIKLPDVSQMKVEVKLHESQVHQVKKDMEAVVTLNSMPEAHFKGRVAEISLLPDSQSRWRNPDLKVFETIVIIEDELPDLKPGNSARVEIIVAELDNVLTVPIQSVLTHDGEQFVFVVRNGEDTPIPVRVGLYNHKYIEIKNGLEEGERVLLAPPRERFGKLARALASSAETKEEAKNAKALNVEEGRKAGTEKKPEDQKVKANRQDHPEMKKQTGTQA